MPEDYTRRNLLKSSVAVAATSVMASSRPSRAQGAGQAGKPLRLGLMTYTLAKDWDIATIISDNTGSWPWTMILT